MMWRSVVISLLLLLSASSCAGPRKSTAPALDSRARIAWATKVSVPGTESGGPALAAGLDGTVYVAWFEGDDKANLWFARIDGDGNLAGPPVRVNPRDYEARFTSGSGDPPTLAVAPDGTVYVGWTAWDEGEPQVSMLYVSASRDGGRSFAAPSNVDDDPGPGDYSMHSLAVALDGRVLVAWLKGGDTAVMQASPAPSPAEYHEEINRELFFASSTDGGRTFSHNLRLVGDVCPCCKTALAVAADGRIYVGWRQVLPGKFRHIAVASSADGGRSFSSPVVVSDDRWHLIVTNDPTWGCSRISGAALSVGGDGRLRVLWYTAGESGPPGLYWAESADGGRTFSPRRAFVKAHERPGTPVLVKRAGGGLTAVWTGVDPQPGSQPVVSTAELAGDARAGEPSMVTWGQFPAAAESGGRFFVAFVLPALHHGWDVWVMRLA